MPTRAVRACLAFLLVAGAAGAQTPPAGPPPPPPPELFQSALDLFNKTGDHEAAVQLLNPYIDALRRFFDQALLRQRLIDAYELRGRIRATLGDKAGAAEDFGALFRLHPDYIQMAGVSPQTAEIIDQVRAQLVGSVHLSVEPADAVVTLDGEPVPVGVERRVVTGPHLLRASRPGYATEERMFTIPGGGAEFVAVALERTSAVVSIQTRPAETEVYLDNVLRGRTKRPDTAGTTADDSGRLVIEGLATGEYAIELRQRCYASTTLKIRIGELADLSMAPVALADAKGTLTVTSDVPDAEVFIDGQPRGRAPVRVQLCEGEYALDVQAPEGRAMARHVVAPSSDTTFAAAPKPTFALVAAPVDPPAAADMEGIAKSFEALRSVTFWIPAAGPAADPERERALVDGERVAGPQASARRVALTGERARALGVQGVAMVSRSAQGPGHYHIDLFARASADPDEIDWVDDRERIREARQQLDEPVRLFRRSLGVGLADLVGYPGPVVVRRAPAGALQPGDVIRSVEGTAVADVAAVGAVLASAGSGTVQAVVESPDGQTRTVPVAVERVPLLHWMEDETRSFNKLALDYAFTAATATDPQARAVARINQSIAYLRLSNWAAARDILAPMATEAIEGLAPGAVAFLLGEALYGLNEEPQARQAWQTASAAGGLLTENGPDIAAVVKRRLALTDRR